MGKIQYYELNGNKKCEEKLNEENLGNINGMMSKCYLIDGTEKVGYADPYRTHDKKQYDNKVHDYIYLWTWDNLDENTHQLIGDDDSKYNQTFIPININEIKNIEVILYSNAKWSEKLTNIFNLKK